MDEIPQSILDQLYDAVADGPAELVRDIVHRYPDTVKEQDDKNHYLRAAASHNQVEVMSLLMKLGADINAPQPDGSPEGAIDQAVMGDAIDAARWLLDRGAKLNHEVKGVLRCQTLVTAAIHGNLELLKLLVEHGANVNACWAGMTPLDQAMMHGQTEIEQYLRSKGAVEASNLASGKPAKNKPKKDAGKKKGK